jgi:hypothetical protein
LRSVEQRLRARFHAGNSLHNLFTGYSMGRIPTQGFFGFRVGIKHCLIKIHYPPNSLASSHFPNLAPLVSIMHW